MRVVSEELAAMWRKHPRHPEALGNRLAPLLVLLIVTVVVCCISRAHLDPEPQFQRWTSKQLLLALGGWYKGEVHAWGVGGYGIIFVGPPENMMVLNAYSHCFQCPIWKAALAATIVMTLSLTVLAVSSLRGRVANPARAVDAPIPRPFILFRYWWRATDQRRSPIMRAERAKLKSCKDDEMIAQGKRSAALG
jgi:hypothetical protein